MSGMRARGWSRQGGVMDLTLGVRPGDDGTVVVVSGEVDVCTEASLQQALLRIMREHGARLLLDVSGISFMDCAGLRALWTTRRRAELRGGFMPLIAVSRAVRRIIELTGAHEALAVERIATDRSAQFFYRTDRMRRTGRSVHPAFRAWADAAYGGSHMQLREPTRPRFD
jgi:anti-sigma B factor antagonist